MSVTAAAAAQDRPQTSLSSSSSCLPLSPLNVLYVHVCLMSTCRGSTVHLAHLPAKAAVAAAPASPHHPTNTENSAGPSAPPTLTPASPSCRPAAVCPTALNRCASAHSAHCQPVDKSSMFKLQLTACVPQAYCIWGRPAQTPTVGNRRSCMHARAARMNLLSAH